MPPFKVKDREDNLAALRQSFRAGREEAPGPPAVLYLEATAICNLRCPMCPTIIGLPRDPYRTRVFDLDLLPKIEPALPFVRRVFLSGGGEPLLHPRLFDIVRALKRHDLEIHFNSNATLMDQERARLILDTGVDTISFSIDGATPETYARIRVGGNLDAVCENILFLAAEKKARGSRTPFLNMQFTAQRENLAEIPEAVRLAAGLGINHLVIEPLTPVYNFDPEYRRYYQAHVASPAEALPLTRRAAALAAELGVLFTSHYLFAADHPEPPRVCAEPWLTFGVRVDGRVFTCCGMIEPMGDLAVSEFDAIWNGPAYRALRRALAAGTFPDCCALCVSENRANHFNEDLLGG